MQTFGRGLLARRGRLRIPRRLARHVLLLALARHGDVSIHLAAGFQARTVAIAGQAELLRASGAAAAGGGVDGRAARGRHLAVTVPARMAAAAHTACAAAACTSGMPR
jgi:hypothetical protein